MRFHHLFPPLLLLCFLSATVLPRFIDPARAQFQTVFAPVARPARGIAQWLRHRVRPEHTVDDASPQLPRPDDDIRRENLALRVLVANLAEQVQQLQLRDAERQKLGLLRDLCTPYSVLQADAGTRESLSITATSFDGVKEGMAVVTATGLVGRLETPGVAGTRVRLITDKGFAMTGDFARFHPRADGGVELLRVDTPPALVRGDGNNSLIIERMLPQQAHALAVNDWMLLNDDHWIPQLQGQRIGRIVAITPSRAPGFMELHLTPGADLMRLQDVMVVKGRETH